MNGQSPNNNQVNQGGTPGTEGISASVLGSVTQPATNVGQTTQPVTPQPSVTPTPATPASPVNPTIQEGPTVAPVQTPNPSPVTPTVNTNVSPAAPAQPTTPVQAAVTPESSPTTLEQPVTQEPVAQPIPGTSATPYTAATSLTGNTVGVGTPNVGQDNLNANGFVEPNKVQNIGQVPPSNTPTNNKTNKKGMNKTLFIVLIIVAIVAVAFGVYYFLSISSKATVNLKEVNIGVGDVVSDNINDYATISGDASSCALNTRNINAQAIGTYSFTITCDGEVYEGTANVVDMIAPVVTLNSAVYKAINSTVTVDEFVESCTDPSNCTTSFTNEATVTNYLSTAGGPYSVEITATDDSGNETIYTSNLYVTPYPIRLFKDCESPSSEVSGYQATKTTRDYLPIGYDANNVYSYLGVSQRIYTYVFTDTEEYSSVIGEKPQTLTFDGITGQAAYDDDNQTITIYTDLSVDTLNSEAGGAFPTTFVEINSYYTNLGYTCSNDVITNN